MWGYACIFSFFLLTRNFFKIKSTVNFLNISWYSNLNVVVDPVFLIK
jgi:hypothetical protein